MAPNALEVDERAPVRIVEYNPEWPALYEKEKVLILRAVGGWVVAIEHVGSTAVPGLAAKPTIDIMVGLRRLQDASFCLEPLRAIDYEYVPEYEASIPDRRYFHKGPPGNRTHHLHVVEFGGVFWGKHLMFRDFLRRDPEKARAYAQLKRDWALRFGRDREGYTDAKTSFIESTLADVRKRKAKRFRGSQKQPP